MERHQRLQQKKVDRSSSISIDRSSQLSPFSTRGFGVQQKASTSTPASKTELWENYQRSTQMGQNGSQKTVLDRSTPIQAKLSIGQPGDKYEQEADSVADRVMAMSEPAQVQREELGQEEEELQMKPLAGSISPLVQREELPEEEELQMKPEDRAIQREALPEEEEELQMKSLDNSIQREELAEEVEELQMKEGSTPSLVGSAPLTNQLPTDSLEDRLSSSKGGGSPLSDDVRSFMEPRFGADFSGVRVHTGSDAVQMNQDVNAQAFAHGSDVYFGAGKAPGKNALTAHELTHVVQQTGGIELKRNSPSLQRECSTCEEKESIQRDSLNEKPLLKKDLHNGSKIQNSIVQRDSAAETQPPDTSTFRKTWAAQIELLYRAYNEKRYGCWCGPGNTCTQIINDIDLCCKAHDEAYEAVGVTSGSGGIGMWTIEGLKRTIIADAILVACTQATISDFHFYGPSAFLYREMVAFVFGTRAIIAAWLLANGF